MDSLYKMQMHEHEEKLHIHNQLQFFPKEFFIIAIFVYFQSNNLHLISFVTSQYFIPPFIIFLF